MAWHLGVLQSKTNSIKNKITTEVCGWAGQVSLGVFFGKFYVFGIICHNVLCVYDTLLKVVRYFDLSVLSVTVMDLK